MLELCPLLVTVFLFIHFPVQRQIIHFKCANFSFDLKWFPVVSTGFLKIQELNLVFEQKNKRNEKKTKVARNQSHALNCCPYSNSFEQLSLFFFLSFTYPRKFIQLTEDGKKQFMLVLPGVLGPRPPSR